MTEEQIFIPLADGTRLAASLFLPDAPAPVVLEALPYRKDDLTASYSGEYRRLRDEGGYAVARVDLRGTGSSDGIATDEYPEQEQKDLVEVIAWLAAQGWSSGNVGMYGTSYSGFNSIQLAMERPSALKAICAIYATDDRYNDDVHYEGGVAKGIDQIDYNLYMTAINSLPPVPSLFGGAGAEWRATWEERVKNNEPWTLRWLEEQNHSPYWQHGSLRPDYDSIEAATMIVGGWADGYRNATFRMFEALTCPKRLLIGPWSHASPETSLPGPHIDLVPEMIRWWDRWLKETPNGIEDEDPIQVFVRRSTVPAPDLASVRGSWRTEPTWPPERLEERALELGAMDGGLGRIEVLGSVGATASLACAGVLPWVQPFDQRPDDALSLTYDFDVPEELEILGYPRLEVTMTSEKPVAYLSVKLQDVFPGGVSANVGRGILNLTHRDSHSDPTALEPGHTYQVTIDLYATSWVFEAGHRIRVSLAGADWPNVWPPPDNNVIEIDPRNSRMVLPVVPALGRPNDPDFAPPPAEKGETPEPTKAVETTEDKEPVYRIEHDALAHQAHVIVDHGSTYETEVGASVAEDYFGRLSVSTEDPGEARAEGKARFEIAWPEATACAEVHMTMTSTATTYRVELDLEVSENASVLWTRRWERDIARRLQ